MIFKLNPTGRTVGPNPARVSVAADIPPEPFDRVDLRGPNPGPTTGPASPAAVVSRQPETALALTTAATFGPAVATLLASLQPKRKPKLAADFVNQFQKELKLSEAARRERDALMQESPAMFFRMYPALFHKDMRGAYRQLSQLAPLPAPRVSANGDCHLGNFGVVKDNGDTIVWGLNDYDQAAPASVEADLERFAVSLVLTGRSLGMVDGDLTHLLGDCLDAYQAELTGQRPAGNGFSASESCPAVAALLAKAASRTQAQLLERYCQDANHFKRNHELQKVDRGTRRNLESALTDYARARPGLKQPLQVLDVVAKAGSGGSSRGLPRFWALVASPDGELPVILELKQLLPSGLATESGDRSLARAQTVLDALQAQGGPRNPLTGGLRHEALEYLVRERERVKADLDLDRLSPDELAQVARQAARSLARATATDPVGGAAVAGWLTAQKATISANLNRLALLYADQVQADFRHLTA